MENHYDDYSEEPEEASIEVFLGWFAKGLPLCYKALNFLLLDGVLC